MNADAFFVIGKTHAICQDYAQAGPLDLSRKFTGPPRIVLSDGCSSSPHSDFGSRFLVMAAEKLLDNTHELFDHTDFSLMAMHTAELYCRTMNLPIDCLCATLLMAQVRKENICCTISGDGALAARHRDTGRYEIRLYEYPSGAPYYLRYLLDRDSLRVYRERFGLKHKTTSYILLPDGKYEQTNEYETDEEEDFVFASGWSLREYDLVALFTDGVRSFMEAVVTPTAKTEKPVCFMQVIKELLQFKNYNGIFVQRRMRRAFDLTMGNFSKCGWINTDDISMGAIVVP